MGYTSKLIKLKYDLVFFIYIAKRMFMLPFVRVMLGRYYSMSYISNNTILQKNSLVLQRRKDPLKSIL